MIWYVCISTIHKCMCGPCILEAFLQSTCRREMPSSTGSYQSVINKDSSEASSSSSKVPSSKKAVIINCPMSQRFLISMERSSSLILLFLHWSEQMIHAAQYIVVTWTALEQTVKLFNVRAGLQSRQLCHPEVLRVTSIRVMLSVSLKALSW